MVRQIGSEKNSEEIPWAETDTCSKTGSLAKKKLERAGAKLPQSRNLRGAVDSFWSSTGFERGEVEVPPRFNIMNLWAGPIRSSQSLDGPHGQREDRTGPGGTEPAGTRGNFERIRK